MSNEGDYKVLVKTDVDFSELDKLKKEIKNLKTQTIEIDVNTAAAVTKITNLKQSINSLGNVAIHLKGASGIETSLDRIANSVDEIKIALSSLGRVSGLQTLSAAATKTGNAFNSGISNVKRFANVVEGINLSHTEKQIENLEAAMDSLDFNPKFKEKFVKDLKEIGLQIDKITTKANDDGSITFTVKGTDELGRAVTAIKKVKEVANEDGTFDLKITGSQQVVQSFNQIDNAATKAKQKFDSIKFDFDTGKLTKNLNEVERDFRKLRTATDDAKSANERFSAAHTALCSALDREDVNINEVIAANKEYEAALEQVKTQIDINRMAQQKADEATRLASDKASLQQDIQVWMKKNSAATEQFGSKLREIISQIERCDREQLSRLRSEFRQTTKEAERLGKTGLNFGDSLKQKFGQYASYFAASFSIMEVVQGLRYMAEAVLEVDTAMTGLRRVTDLTAVQYDVLYDKMIKSAKEYGATLTDVVNATSDWVRAGFDSDVAVGLAEITTMYQHISDLDYDTAAENLITAYNGFKQELLGLYDGDEVAAVGYIADVFNELDNNFAATSAGLGEALTRSASALDLAGNSIQESAAMVTGITEVTQDPEKAGSALKILSLRLRGMKGQLEEIEAGAGEGVESVSKMQTQILNMTKGTVNIFDDDGSFKSTYEIMSGIADIWDELSSIDQAELLEAIAGKHRANDVAALISNWDNVKSAVQSALDAEGSAAEENAKYVDSLQGRLDKLTAAWQSFANTTMNSDFLKNAVSALTKFVELVEGLIEHLGTLGTIGLGVGIFGLFKKRDGITTHFKGLSDTLAKATTTTEKFGIATKSTGKAMLSSLVKSPMAAATAIGLVTAAISLAITAFKNYKEEQARIRQETIDTSNAFLDSAGSFEQAYIKYSGRTNLTAEEEAELETAIKGTVDALDDKSSALQSVVDSSSDYLESLEQIAKAELEEAAAKAKAKKEAAKTELEESAMGWFTVDGSEVDVKFNSDDANEASEEAKKIANEVGGEYVRTLESVGKEGNKVVNGFKLSENASVEEITEYYYMLLKYQEKLSDADLADTVEYENVTSAIDKMSEAIGLYTDGVYDAAKAEYQLANGIPKTTNEYLKMRESILSDTEGSVETKKIMASTLDSEYGLSFDLTSAEVQSRKLIGIIDGFGDEQAKDFEVFLNMRSAVNDGECTVGEYISSFNDINETISGFDADAQEEINLSFGLDTDTVKQQYNDLVETINSAMENASVENFNAESFVGNLTASELSAAIKLDAAGEINWVDIDTKELREKIQAEAAYLMAMEFTIDVDAETEGLEKFNSALAESRSATGLTMESFNALQNRYKGLEGYDAATLFQETANGISLNAEAVNELESAYANARLEETDTALEDLQEKYNSLGVDIQNCSDAARRADLVNEREDIRAKIVELAEYATALEGLTSSYNEWQNAEAAGNDRDMYATVHSAMEGVDKELELGWIDDGTEKYFQLIWGKDKWNGAGKSIEDYRKKWNTLDDTIQGTSYSIEDFFKTNDDGELTSEGIFNFFDAVGEKQKELGEDWIKYDKDGGIDSFNFGVDGDKAIADALGVSEELVQIFLRASQDAGFVVNFDGTYTQLANLQNEAIEAVDGLNEALGTEYTFDFNSQSLTDLNSQLNTAKEILKNKDFWNADGTFNFDADGAKEAMTIVSTLQATIDNLDNSYIGITTNDDDFKEPLEKLQDYESKVAQLNQLKLNPEVNKEDIKTLEDDLEGIVDYFDNLDEKTKIELGIEGLSKDEIKEQIETGKIEIPASLDLQMSMNESLEDLVKISLLNSGVLSEDEELEIKQEFKLKYEESEDSEGSEEINEKAQEDAENAGNDPIVVQQQIDLEFETPEEKLEEIQQLTEGLEDEKKSVVIDFISNNADEFWALSKEERQVVVDLITDGSSLEALEGYQVEIEAFAKIFGVEKVDDLKAKLDGLDDEQIQILAKVIGQIDVEKLKTAVSNLDDKTVEAIAKALGEGDVEGLKTTINGLDDKTVQAIAQALGYSDVNELNGAIDSLDPKTVQAIAQALGITDVDSLRGAVNRLDNKTVQAVANVDGKDDVVGLKGAIDSLKGKTITVWATIKKKASDLWNSLTGGGGVDGTAHANGTAFAEGAIRKTGHAFKQGNWGTKEDGTALVGELGAETLVRNGRYYVIGEDSAEFIKYKKGDIIFNAAQTEELFSKGKIKHGSGRGKALSGGTAFASGTLPSSGRAFSNGTGADKPTYGSSSSSSSKSKSSSSSSSDDADEFLEKMDWIEIAIDRIERAISKLDLKASSVFKKWSTRNSALVDEIAKVREEIDLQERGAARYLEEANSVGLSSAYAAKVRNGEIDIEDITDEDLKEKIDEYQQW